MRQFEYLSNRDFMQQDAGQISLNGNIWQRQEPDEGECSRLADAYGLPHILASMLCARGVAFDDVENFLYPKLQKLMPDPYVLKDMQKAAERMAQAVQRGQKVAIIGDYDVDGATSTSILTRFLRQVSINPIIHIPSREEGYGPSDLAFAEFKKSGADLVITIDCGTTAFDVLNRAATEFDIIVIDHHEAEVILPKVYAVVNPKRLDEENPYKYLEYMSAVGVGFMFLVAVNRLLREQGFYKNKTEPELMRLLDLVALGTVCDVVPLLGLNRAYVKQGLKVMAAQQNMGLKYLMKELKFSGAPTTYHLGFVLGPRINACGRVGDASLGSKLLCSENEVEAQELAQKFDTLNTDRKEIEKYVFLAAMEQVESKTQEYPMIFVYGKDWHQGVIGIVAGKLKERYHAPAFVMSIEEDEVKGSARSIEGLDLGALIISAKEKGLISGGGGHIMAAGFSLKEEQIPAFRQFVGEYVVNNIGNEKIVPQLPIDYTVSLNAVNIDLSEQLNLLEPYGSGNAEPIICVKDVSISWPQIIGSGHIKCTLVSALGAKVSAIAFRAVDSNLGNALLNSRGEVCDVVGHLKADDWQGRKRVQFIILDMMRKQ